MSALLQADAAASTDVTHDGLEAAIAVLRERADSHGTLDDALVLRVFELVLSGHGPQQLVLRTGLSPSELFTLVKAIGDRYRTRGEEIPEGTGGILFPLEQDPGTLAALPKRKHARVLGEIARMRSATPLPLEWQFSDSKIPLGTRNAVAAIRSSLDGDANLQAEALKFCMSYDPPVFRVTTFALLAGTWRAAQTGQLTRFALSEALTDQAAASVVHAFDTLEAVRSDAVDAVTQLMETVPQDMETMAVRARPLMEAPVVRLEHGLKAAEGSDREDFYRNLALTKFRNEAQVVQLPRHVGELNDGHVTRIAGAVGVLDGPPREKDLAAATERIEELGYHKDFTFLRGLWAAYYGARREANFWEALKSLDEGNPDWARPLQ